MFVVDLKWSAIMAALQSIMAPAYFAWFMHYMSMQNNVRVLPFSEIVSTKEMYGKDMNMFRQGNTWVIDRRFAIAATEDGMAGVLIEERQREFTRTLEVTFFV